MARQKPRTGRLIKSAIDAAQPASDRYIIWDDRLKGFGLRVETSGVKTYLVRYRTGVGGRKAVVREFKIGRVGDPGLTPDEARKRAGARLAEAKLGGDPQGERARLRAETTVAEFCDWYQATNPAGKKASTRAVDKVRIERHIKPIIGALRLSEVRRADVERVAATVTKGDFEEKSAWMRGGPYAASRTVGLLQGIFKRAVEDRIIAENPAHRVSRVKDRKRERFLAPAELARLIDAIAEMTAPCEVRGRRIGGMVTTQHAQIIKLLLLTGARKNEIVRLRWTEVDQARGFLGLADSKTGQKSVLLGADALGVLGEAKRGASEFVFPEPDDPSRPLRNLDWAWVGVRKRAGLGDVRLHDLRHTFASFAATNGHPLAHIGKLLGHKHVQTTQRYAHLANDAIRAAADDISARVQAAMSTAPIGPAPANDNSVSPEASARRP